MPDVRSEKSRTAIKDALLRLLENKSLNEVSMAELAREANLSRSTLYMHFDTPRGVFDELVGDFHKNLRPLATQLSCKDCCENSAGAFHKGIPFCKALRSESKYRTLVKDTQYLSSMLEIECADTSINGRLAPYLEAGLNEEEAKELFRFQMSGCYNAAMNCPDEESWSHMQRIIDAFISGGLSSLKSRSTNQLL